LANQGNAQEAGRQIAAAAQAVAASSAPTGSGIGASIDGARAAQQVCWLDAAARPADGVIVTAVPV